MSFTTEITLWCDAQVGDFRCGQWIQFNYADAQGHPRKARRLASEQGWTWNADKGDRCREHSR